MSDKAWNSNEIQFPRLLSEIVATQDKLDMPALCESMDITMEELNELFDRAQQEWEDIKNLVNVIADIQDAIDG